jgi:hypothetical protein
VREPRKGAIGRATGIAEGVAAAMRRRQRSREPRVLLYDELGHSRLLPPEAPHRDRILDICEELVALTAPRRPEPETEAEVVEE